jgi:septin family protein
MTESSFVHDDISSDEEERSSRPVIKLRASRHLSKKGLSRSRSCIRDKHEPQRLDPEEDENLATIRFSAQTLANTELSSLLPFAFIAPESGRRHPDKCPGIGIRRSVGADGDPSSPAASPKSQKRDGYVRPETLNGVFLRKFRWGTVDVLNPEHCDFAALRNTIFSTHFTV